MSLFLVLARTGRFILWTQDQDEIFVRPAVYTGVSPHLLPGSELDLCGARSVLWKNERTTNRGTQNTRVFENDLRPRMACPQATAATKTRRAPPPYTCGVGEECYAQIVRRWQVQMIESLLLSVWWSWLLSCQKAENSNGNVLVMSKHRSRDLQLVETSR